jgi:ribonuclease T2
VNDSKVSQFFMRNVGKTVTLQQVRYQFDSSFGKGSGKKVELRCKNGLITELWLHLGRSGQNLETMLKEGRKVHSRCTRGMIDAAGFRR